MKYSFSQIPVDVPHIATKYRRIQTAIPTPEALQILSDLEKYESRSMHGQLPVVWDRAENFQVYDSSDNCWIDFTSTIFVTNAGHSNPLISSAIQRTVERRLLHTYTFANKMRAAFLKKLIEMTPNQFEKAFLLSSGTEATECAIKLTRMHGRSTNPAKIGIVSFQGVMHGRTMGAEMLRGPSRQSDWIGYFDPNMHHLPFPYPWYAKGNNFDWRKRFRDDMGLLEERGLNFNNIAGFMIESYLGWGAIFYPIEYIKALAEFADEHSCLVVFDEIQGGLGRTGKMFVYQHYGVEPDMLCLGKALSGSLPLSAVISSRKIMDLPEAGSMSSTHSANPLCCAAGLANLEAIEADHLVDESKRKGELLHKKLSLLKDEYPDRISHIFGKGLLAGVLFKDSKTGDPDTLFPSIVCERAMQKGLLLVHTGRESIKIGPPLTIPDDALEEGLDVFHEAIVESIHTAK